MNQHELKRANSHYYKNTRRQDVRRTLNHWHGRLEMYLLRYQVNTAVMTN